MFIIVEVDELRDLIDRTREITDPDLPIDESVGDLITIEKVTELFDILLGTQEDIPDTIEDLVCDDELIELASYVLRFIRERLHALGRLEWVRVVDQNGGLVIRIDPGELKCRI